MLNLPKTTTTIMPFSELKLESQSIQAARRNYGDVLYHTILVLYFLISMDYDGEFPAVGLYNVCNDYHSYETTFKIGLSTFN